MHSARHSKLPNVGVFYVVQLEPRNAPRRIKLGWAWQPYRRLQKHRTAAPYARLLAFWRCPRNEERQTIRRLTIDGCRRVGRSNEVFVVADLQTFCEQFAEKLLRHALNEAFDLPLPYHWPD